MSAIYCCVPNEAVTIQILPLNESIHYLMDTAFIILHIYATYHRTVLLLVLTSNNNMYNHSQCDVIIQYYCLCIQIDDNAFLFWLYFYYIIHTQHIAFIYYYIYSRSHKYIRMSNIFKYIAFPRLISIKFGAKWTLKMRRK